MWALLFTTIGYLGGEVVGPWLHHLDAHLKHWIWLILAVVVVVAAHWWLRRRESKKKTKRRARGRTVVGGYFTVWW